MARLIKSKPIQPLYTRGGTPIVDGFDPLGPGAPINTPFPTEIQNPNQIKPNQMRGGAGTVGVGRGSAGPARTGAFGYGIRRSSFSQYSTPITDPISQAPGAPISNRPIVPIGPGEGMRGQGGGRGQGGPIPSSGTNPRQRDVSQAPAASNVAVRGASIGAPLASVGVRAAVVGRSTASSAGRVTAAPAKAAAPAAPKATTTTATTTTPSKTKKAGKSGSLARR